MKRLSSLLLMLAAFGVTSFAQMQTTPGAYKPSKNVASVKRAVDKTPAVTGLEAVTPGGNVSVPAARGFFGESLAGLTTYDLQSNNCMPRRIHNWGGGQVSATWTMSRTGAEANGFPDRGTGYNVTDNNGVMGAPPETRVENVRTGFTSYSVSPNGEEWIAAHGPSNSIRFAHKQKTATTWTQGTVPTTTPNGGLWARVATGGADGNTVHIIYLTAPTGNGGAVVDGFDGCLKYCRSTNGGASWDIVDLTLPIVTTSVWGGVTADAYAIDAYDNTVAIAVCDFRNDVVMVKSSDNGTTWEPAKLVHDFPLDKWNFDDGYTIDQIIDKLDVNIWPAPNGVTDSLALLACDGSCDILVDYLGKVHVAWAPIFYRDPDTTADNSFNWYPTYDLGIIHWTEDDDTDGGYIVGRSPDIDGDGVWGISGDDTNTDGYRNDAFSTLPSMGIDADGRVYVVFISNHELYVNDDVIHYKHPFITRSEPYDFTVWSDVKPVTNNNFLVDTISVTFSEYFFASVAKNVDEFAHIVYQRDYDFGLNLVVTGNQDPVDNFIEYLPYPVSDLISGVKDRVNTIGVAVSPNPATNRARIQFELGNSANVQVEVFNAVGARVLSQMTEAASGLTALDINTASLTNGLYFVRVNAGGATGTARLMIAK